MKLYMSSRFHTAYLVKGNKVYFYSVTRKRFMPTTRGLPNLLTIADLVGNNFKVTNPKHEAFKYVN